MKKAIKIFFISLLCLMILAGVLVYMAFGDLVSGALSVKKIDDKFYYMEYSGDDVETHQNTEKPDLTTTAAIAYLLKNAATVNEAIELLNKIDMHSDIGSAHHYAMFLLSSSKLKPSLMTFLPSSLYAVA